MNFSTQANQMQELLSLRWPPVAITFRADAPIGITRISTPAPSGCSYWKLAAEGQVFYTEAADHYGCPIGAYTHGVNLPPAQANELQGMVKTMIDLDYLREEEVAAIPHRDSPFGVAVYAPLANAPLDPDVILIRGNAKQMMLIAEAASAAGLSHNSIMGRPTCAVVPEVMESGNAAMSLGCIGNRVYNELEDDELYFAIPCSNILLMIEKLIGIIQANQKLEDFHRKRQETVM